MHFTILIIYAKVIINSKNQLWQIVPRVKLKNEWKN